MLHSSAASGPDWAGWFRRRSETQVLPSSVGEPNPGDSSENRSGSRRRRNPQRQYGGVASLFCRGLAEASAQLRGPVSRRQA